MDKPKRRRSSRMSTPAYPVHEQQPRPIGVRCWDGVVARDRHSFEIDSRDGMRCLFCMRLMVRELCH